MNLFEGFKVVKKEFDICVKIWEAATEIEIYKSKDYHWYNGHFTEFDGNPMITYYNDDKKKQIRVIQLDPKVKTKHPFAVYYDYIGDADPSDKGEIVFSCILTEKNLEKYKVILRKWLAEPNVSIEELEKLGDAIDIL